MNIQDIKFEEPNITIGFGENVQFNFRMKKTILNRIKMKALCFCFPIKLINWDTIK